jgi:hypothetical protein
VGRVGAGAAGRAVGQAVGQAGAGAGAGAVVRRGSFAVRVGAAVRRGSFVVRAGASVVAFGGQRAFRLAFGVEDQQLFHAPCLARCSVRAHRVFFPQWP